MGRIPRNQPLLLWLAARHAFIKFVNTIRGFKKLHPSIGEELLHPQHIPILFEFAAHLAKGPD